MALFGSNKKTSDSSIIELPVLPLRSMVLFPSSVMPLAVARPATLRALEAAQNGGAGGKQVAVITQRDPQRDSPTFFDLYRVGTLGTVLRVAHMADTDGPNVAFIEGTKRVRIIEQAPGEDYLRVRVEPMQDIVPSEKDAEYTALEHNVRDLFHEIVSAAPDLPDDLLPVASHIEDASVLADFVAASVPFLSQETRQQLLETTDVRRRMRLLTEQLVKARQDQQLRDKIRAEVAEKITDSQRRYILREQLKAIQRELGEEEPEQRDVAELRERIQAAGLSKEAQQEAERELSRLERIPAASPEYSVARTYLDWLASLPWNITRAQSVDIHQAAAVLDEDHYDLEKVKQRVLEFLAVYQLKPDLKGPILCFVGPPGVGKTSVCKSIARATGRAYVRISLGGVHDEAEIRGHRRTYVGALPGQIIQAIRRAGTRDPVFVLDEVDKIGTHFQGDPAAALLEVLDPEQNVAFRDHYLDAPFDLSQVLFITTANILDPVPPALRDRMEVIELPGYIDDEKLHIAKRYLVPKETEANGLDGDDTIHFTDEALLDIIHSYTHEAGVRAVQQKIAAICRKHAKAIAEAGGVNAVERLEVTVEVARQMLGVPRFRIDTQLAERTRRPGVAVAVAWTPYGGEILFVEATRMPRDRGELTITGQVRDVMQESVKAALSWLRSHCADYDIDPDSFRRYDLHIHIPSGAVPKDGPSAGIVMVAALFSLFTDEPIRPYLAMSGEITLTGLVLPVGGIKEKVLAAKRSGVREMVLPAENRADVEEEIAAPLLEGIELHFVKTIAEALEIAFGISRRPRAAASHLDEASWDGAGLSPGLEAH